jgi:hypothetical protein
MSTALWKTDQYFVSPLNYRADVREEFKLPDKVKIHDITFCDSQREIRGKETITDLRRISRNGD